MIPGFSCFFFFKTLLLHVNVEEEQDPGEGPGGGPWGRAWGGHWEANY